MSKIRQNFRRILQDFYLVIIMVFLYAPIPHRTMGLWLSGKGKHKPQNTGDCPDRGSLCRNVLYL